MRPVAVASFAARVEDGAVRVALALDSPFSGTVQVFRSTSSDFATRQAITAPLAVSGARFEHIDRSMEAGVPYFYWVILEGADGSTVVSGPVQAMFPSIATTLLARPSPNPITAGSRFAYVLGADVCGPGAVEVSLAVLDVQGRKLRELVHGPRATGRHRVRWDGNDENGSPVPAGVLFLQLRAGSLERMARISVVR